MTKPYPAASGTARSNRSLYVSVIDYIVLNVPLLDLFVILESFILTLGVEYECELSFNESFYTSKSSVGFQCRCLRRFVFKVKLDFTS